LERLKLTIVKKYFRHILKIPDEDIVFINKTMSQKKIDEMLTRFHGNMESSIPIKEQKTARYIIATSAAFSVGLTLAEAMAIIFLEPDFRASTMTQGFSRHWRQGNKNKEVQSILLLAKDNKVEERIMMRNNLRAGIQKAATRKVNEPLKMVTQEVDMDLYDAE